MLDFSRTNFTKQISLTPKKSQHIATKWPLAKIKSCFDINKTSFNPESKPNQEFIYVDIDSVGKGTGIIEYNNKILGKDAPSRARRIAEKNDIIISSVRPYLKAFALVDKDVKDCLFSTGFFVISTKDKKLYSNQYLLNLFMEFEPLMSQIESTMGKGQYPSINKTDITNFKIPLPTIDVQKEIATECNKIEKNKEKSLQKILVAKKTIEEIIDDTFKDSSPKKIGDLCVVQSGGTPKRNVSEYWNGNINWVGSRVCQNRIISESIVEEKITELGLKNSSARLFSKETTLIALVGATIGKVAFLNFETTTNQNIAGINPKDKSVLLPKYLFYVLLATYESNFNKDKGKFTMANLTRIKNLLIPFVAIKEQKRIIKLIEKQESIIKKKKHY
ncbi:restriction endonuclease subunit S [Pseudotamlana carrageenivorans]|uniref:Type I restriction modification DNA specificity domain-containing protein n=1 Tax=Pseudotamlana carrageenivorans TaxID=2069432 RepID=A0A2I7SLQ4_9FLAO|nr:restriction endonuclease subunit S [Tamlana carrageenivorans]AUS06845.1 hypothetical protein C1A40_15965 [Tamlana carrageenivorans]